MSRSDQRSKSGVLTFWTLGTGIIDSHGSISGKMFSYAWLRYAMSKGHTLTKGQDQGQVTKGHCKYEL